MRTDYYAHIPLSANYIERSDLLINLRTLLLDGPASIALISALKSTPTALHGMGGIGKSILARAWVMGSSHTARFALGILWVTLGQTPNLSAHLREWIEAVGSSVTGNAPSIESLSTQLDHLLAGWACLLVIDDVWQIDHVSAFNRGGEQCKVLVTTRNADKIDNIIAYHLSIRADEQTIQYRCNHSPDRS